MRSRLSVIVLIAAAFVATTLLAGAPETFGAGVSLAETTPIAKLIEAPGTFTGRTIRIEGVVTSVCTAMGCWMALAPADQADAKPVMIQVDHDGKIVFPVSAKGHRAAAQGVFERINGGEGQEAASELAAQQGAPSEITKFRIKATGAVVY